jgi:lipopolysaccharide biosynthesis glycosyltransferase
LRVLVGVGGTQKQKIPFQVLKHSIGMHKNTNEYVIEEIFSWECYKEFCKSNRTDFGTVFSLQRFFVCNEALRRNFDVFVHLDSDMVVLRSLDKLIGEVVNCPKKLIIPAGNPKFHQNTQTAVFAGFANDLLENKFHVILNDFLANKIEYKEAMQFETFGEMRKFVPHIYNSREEVEHDTVILHLTDLLRQPWVSPFNKYSKLWRSVLFEMLEKQQDSKGILDEGIKAGFYRKGILSTGVPIRDLAFIPPQYESYRKRFEHKKNLVGLVSKSNLIWSLLIHLKGFFRMLTNYRGV